MDLAETIKSIQPLKGEVVPIRTIQETQPPEKFDDAYVAEVNVKAASKVIKALDAAFPRDVSLPMSHLRRFAKRNMLPQHLLSALEADSATTPTTNGQTIFVLISPPLPAVETLQTLLAPYAPVPRRRSSATPPVNSPGLSSPIASPASPEPQPPKIRLLKTRIPIYAPFNANQAEQWTRKMWPVVFNPAAPRSTVAPPPQILNRALDSIKPRAGYYLSLARKVADESKQSGRGRGVGAVVVDPAIEAEIETKAWEQCRNANERWMDAVVSVGGDARYGRSEAGAPSQADKHPGVAPNPASTSYHADLEGGPDLHALMRATELVARRRREDTEHQAQYASSLTPVIASDPQLSNKLSPLESYFLYEVCGTHSTAALDHPVAPLSPRKRKHEDPNPETGMASLNVNPEASIQDTPSIMPLPAPPPSSMALADPTIPTPSIDPTNPISNDERNATPLPQTSRIRTRAEGGYLCTDLDIYLSHEPCMCCSMGMLLSRFRAVIFPRTGRMLSGGIASEPIIGPTPVDYDSDDDNKENIGKGDETAADRVYYGLHWRKELNWRALGFEFVEFEGDEEEGNWTEVVADHGDGEDQVFHA
ncbi:uncharacterized protein N7482_004621 [Penicillium canariense]|uniref:tRNA-specific adenosine-34 deaminase subunit Tad3 n=1 Tax=Penicillium canariense TaxID=189055 RepID=A0A9W9IAP6_9EURO|nr:uncharacterized protein N7482_004621 [Penicillium canariense]KAJ5169027.1 hypothetical protein N7482_004621 [Penicillium canariense]